MPVTGTQGALIPPSTVQPWMQPCINLVAGSRGAMQCILIRWATQALPTPHLDTETRPPHPHSTRTSHGTLTWRPPQGVCTHGPPRAHSAFSWCRAAAADDLSFGVLAAGWGLGGGRHEAGGGGGGNMHVAGYMRQVQVLTSEGWRGAQVTGALGHGAGLQAPGFRAWGRTAGTRFFRVFNNNNNKRPLTPKSMPPAGDEHAKLKT